MKFDVDFCFVDYERDTNHCAKRTQQQQCKWGLQVFRTINGEGPKPSFNEGHFSLEIMSFLLGNANIFFSGTWQIYITYVCFASAF